MNKRELRTLTAILNPLPISTTQLNQVGNKLRNCSKRLKRFGSMNETLISKSPEEYGADEELPPVTRRLFVNCHEVWQLLNKTAGEKYPHELAGEDELAFQMIGNNVTVVLNQLDWIRKNRRKFVCINDDIDHDRADSKRVRHVLREFYESMFPLSSQFELKSNLRNRFLYKHDLDEWTRHSKLISQEGHYLAILLVLLLVFYFLRTKVYICCRLVFKLIFSRGRRIPDDLDI